MEKRLIKKASMTLYHGTSLWNCEDIIESGALQQIPGRGVGFSFTGDEEDFDNNLKKAEGFIFLSDSFELTSSEYGSESFPNAVVIELNISDQLYPDDIDCPECTTYQESLKKFNQLKVKGPISIDNITKIHILDSNEVLTVEEFKERYLK